MSPVHITHKHFDYTQAVFLFAIWKLLSCIKVLSINMLNFKLSSYRRGLSISVFYVLSLDEPT